MLRFNQRGSISARILCQARTSSTPSPSPCPLPLALPCASDVPISPFRKSSVGVRHTHLLRKVAMSETNCNCSCSTAECTASKPSKSYSTSSSGNGGDDGGMAQLVNVDVELKKWKDGISLEGLPAEHKAVHAEHLKAVEKGQSSYVDPVTGFEVFTILSHLRRGYCCGNACRHCPFLHSGVSQQYKQFKKFNSAFYA